MKTAKLLICYHKPDVLIRDEILTPIHVGRANAKKRMSANDPKLKWLLENMIGDDTGDNISSENGSYNELTSLYWAWKNYDELGDPDYIGLMHYRRHFVFNEGEIKVYNIPDMESEHYLDELNYSPEKLIKMLEECDFACHLGRVDGIYKHYLANHRIEDMELALDILKRRYPSYSKLADEYMKQDVGNFCNMFIFPREMFFEYCEYIFSILKEFSETVDTSEKRFFISERLTGIFIYKKIKSGLKYKVFPINFTAEKINIPVAYPLKSDNLFSVCVSVISALENAKPTTSFTFYLMHGDDIGKKIKSKFKVIENKYKNCKFEFIHSELPSEYYPIEISERIPKVNKCVFFTEKAVAMHDLAEFYRTCSVDDYYISGLPEMYLVNDSETRKLSGDIFMLNCARFRKYKIFERGSEMMSENSALEILNELCRDQIGYFAEWFVTFAGNTKLYDRVIISKNKSRSQFQVEATWKPVLYFGENEPWINIQGVYSNFWWNFANVTPFLFKFPDVSGYENTDLLNEQQREINHIGAINRRVCADDMCELFPKKSYNPMTVVVKDDEKSVSDYEKYKKFVEEISDYKFVQRPFENNSQKQKKRRNRKFEINDENPGMIVKMKRYYKQFGFKQTVKRVGEKLAGK